jgi:hypothetical protein
MQTFPSLISATPHVNNIMVKFLILFRPPFLLENAISWLSSTVTVIYLSFFIVGMPCVIRDRLNKSTVKAFSFEGFNPLISKLKERSVETHTQMIVNLHQPHVGQYSPFHAVSSQLQVTLPPPSY